MRRGALARGILYGEDSRRRATTRTAGEEGRGGRDEESVSSLQVGRTRTTEREGGKGGGEGSLVGDIFI